MGRDHFARKPTFKGTLSKLAKNGKLIYTYARKSLPVASPKELLLFCDIVNLLVGSESH